MCLAGSADADAPHDHFVSVHALVDCDVTVRQAMQQAGPLLKQRATTAVAEFLS
jgi:hypothetical protein